MSARPIAYNLVRLVQSAIHNTPRGVDRVDFGYLSHLFETWPGEIYGILPNILGMRFYSRERVLRGRDRLAALWREHGGAADDAALERVIDRLGGRRRAGDPSGFTLSRAAQPGLLSPPSLYRMAHVLLGDGFSLGRPMRDLPKDAVYLDIGHYGITFPGAFKWRPQRPDIAPVFLIHDVIPLDYPHFVANETVTSHERVMKKVARHARALIVPTASAGESIARRLEEWNAPPKPIHAVPLPIDDLFLNRIAPNPALQKHPYFVICGAIEPRKNHALLLDIWDGLVRDYGTAAPRLVIAGAPGFRSDEVLARIAGSPHLSDHVIAARGLSSPALAELMAGARAVLMPSFAEGFGLPPVEAMALGTPALVSDIPAHHDANRDWALFRAPDDHAGWRRDILWLSQDGAEYLALKQRLSHFRPASWPTYMTEIGRILQDV
ncbi:glycosyltransferase family 1 protein [Rhabdaerophilum sp. SD176]|uniref:glycosyltransferase family 4 protein n=1 Tax=Rhabdaerophilum sp. SD176 TaxID=2983548 RepID=UPI0024DFBB1E|nr:glycosyltransferase family 1 protein [Rhabdaerophilum sp. SD176]